MLVCARVDVACGRLRVDQPARAASRAVTQPHANAAASSDPDPGNAESAPVIDLIRVTPQFPEFRTDATSATAAWPSRRSWTTSA